MQTATNMHERIVRNFCMVRNLIDSEKHPAAYRVLHFIPGWYFLDIETERQAEQAAEFIINDVRFWRWFVKQGAMLKQTMDINLALALFSVTDDEKKVLTDDEVRGNLYYRLIVGRKEEKP